MGSRCGDPNGAKERIGSEYTSRTNKVQVPRSGAFIPESPTFAVRGTSVCGRVTSAPLRKANWLADRLHSIGRFEGRRQSKPGKWTRWGLSECQDGEPIRTKAMGGPAGPEISGEGVPKALIRRVLTKERGAQ